MQNLKKIDIDDLSYKAEIEHRHRGQTYVYQGRSGGGMNQEIGIKIYMSDTMHKTDNQ